MDSSSLCKLYYEETDSLEVEGIFTNFEISSVVLSELAEVEFSSTIWKKVRTKELTESEATSILSLFETDLSKYEIVSINREIIERAKNLLNTYGEDGLRTLDSIQLATCCLIKNEIDLFHTADKLLNKLFLRESLSTTKSL